MIIIAIIGRGNGSNVRGNDGANKRVHVDSMAAAERKKQGAQKENHSVHVLATLTEIGSALSSALCRAWQIRHAQRKSSGMKIRIFLVKRKAFSHGTRAKEYTRV